MKSAIHQLETVINNNLILFNNKVSVDISEIILLEGDLNYTHLYLRKGKKITIARTLKVFEKALKTYHFHRIHRAFLINERHLKSYNFDLGEALLTENHKIIASRRRKVVFEELLNLVN